MELSRIGRYLGYSCMWKPTRTCYRAIPSSTAGRPVRYGKLWSFALWRHATARMSRNLGICRAFFFDFASAAAEVELLMPTARSKQRSDDVLSEVGDDDDDTRPLTASVVGGRRWSVHQPTGTPAVDSRSAVGRTRDPDAGWTSNPLYLGVPAACACVLLSLTVLGVLLVRHGRDRRVDGRRGKSVALLPLSLIHI